MAPDRLLTPLPLPASIEATPQVAATNALRGLLPRGTEVYLTDLGNQPLQTTIDAAVRLRDLGYEPVPHIAARGVATRTILNNFLARITGEAGVRNVLVIGGGAAKPLGPYAASIELLETGLFDHYGISRIGIAGHPEGSPDVSNAKIDEALRLKVAFANRSGATLRIVTQFGFDHGAAISWLEGLDAAGFDIPVHLGVAGPAKISTLLKYATMCGVGPSLNFLRSGTGLLTAIATNYSPDSYVEPVERWHEAATKSLLAGIQVFPFGGIELAANWLNGRGSFKMKNEVPLGTAIIQESGNS